MPDQARYGMHTDQLTKNMSPGQGSDCLGFGAGHREARLQLGVDCLVCEYWSLTVQKCRHSRSQRDSDDRQGFPVSLIC